MTIKQKQCLLCYLGFYTGAIDGIWGPKSEAALKEFREAYRVSGEYGEALIKAVAEDDWWSRIRHFTRAEFACKCGVHCDGYPAEIRRELAELADDIRAHFEKPAIVISGLRCEQHNADVGGVANSQHIYGEAVDLKIPGVSAGELVDYIRLLPGVRYVYAINDTNVHFDIAKGVR